MSKRKSGDMDVDEPASKRAKLARTKNGERLKMYHELAKDMGFDSYRDPEMTDADREEIKAEVRKRLGGPKERKVPTKKRQARKTVGGRKVLTNKRGKELKNNKGRVYYGYNEDMPEALKSIARGNKQVRADNMGHKMSVSKSKDYFANKYGNNVIYNKKGAVEPRLSTKAARLVTGLRDEGRVIIDLAAAIAMAAGTNQVREVHMLTAMANWNLVERYCSTGAGVYKVLLNTDVLIPAKTDRFPAFSKVVGIAQNG